MNGGLRNVEMEKNKEISWTEHITNEELLTMIREERAMIRTIRKRQKKIHWTLTQRRLVDKNSNRWENGGKENKKKTKTDNAILDDGIRTFPPTFPPR